MERLATTIKAVTEVTIDPVCGMEFGPAKTRLVTIHQGQSYLFCNDACRQAFETNP